ncbi:MAG: D-alanyl-D-alanine carboxypeptidase/D-alanyl-D-alanine-endopeptidase [Myxococcota bacterium]|nr:D-alanyl-D-alanine carboxypeptidase/D-alanyl-D-alanine-endopeptidase [Myxococcota bacterium]
MRLFQASTFVTAFAVFWAAEATFATNEASAPLESEPALEELDEAAQKRAADAADKAAVLDALNDLTRNRIFRESEVALHLVELDTGETVFSHGGDQGLTPASTMKVLTAAAALRELGPSFRFTTQILSDGKVNAKGELDGNLYVRGGGDPSMVIEKLWKMVYDLKLEGIRSITGNIIFDDSYFDDRTRIAGWNKQKDIDRGPSYFAPVGALSLNFNTVAVVVGPGEEVGGPARVSVETPSPGIVEVDNQMTTGSSRSSRRVGMDRSVDGRSMTLTLTGSVPSGGDSTRYYRSVADPTAYFMAAFAAQMSEQGIEVRGRYEEGVAAEELDLLLQVQSPPLASILMDMNKYSSNFIAEQVLKAVGAETSGEAGSTLKGIEAISAYLGSLGISDEEYVLVNGSGLSRRIVLRPDHLTAVLTDMAKDAKVSPEFMASLAIGGRDGTLWSRFRDEKQVDRLRGKTGTINGVHCLAGYIDGPNGKTYAFAYLVNRLRGGISRARKAHDQFVETLMEPAQGTVP